MLHTALQISRNFLFIFGAKVSQRFYQRQVSSIIGYFSKMVGFTYSDWHKHKINVARAGANCNPKHQRIPKSKHLLLAIRALVHDRQAKSEELLLDIFWILCISYAGSPLTNLIQRCLPLHCAVFNATFLIMDSVVSTSSRDRGYS